ncbi:LptE family protein [Candidatus Fermentibacterales bacterium]|nr:LptE family protein [Candidatus Fermentibacterales bacterium]
MTNRCSLVAVALVLLCAGCPYGVRGNLPGHLTTVTILQMRSQTSEYGLEQQLTSLVVEAMVSDGRLAVVSSGADAVLEAVITGFSRTPYSYTSSEVVEEYKLQISVRIDFEDRVQEVALLESETVAEWVIYDPDTETFVDAKARLLADAAEEIVRRTLSGW